MLPWELVAEHETKFWRKVEFNSGSVCGKAFVIRTKTHLHNTYHILWETRTSIGEKPKREYSASFL